MIIDLTAVRDGTGPARLLDMVEGRSKQAFKTWLAERDEAWRDGGRGRRDGRVHRLQDRRRRGAARRGRGDGSLPRRRAWPARRSDECRRRVQQAIHGHRGRKGDPLYAARRTLSHRRRPAHRQADRPPATRCSPATQHVEVEATWGIYQRMIAAYRHEDRTPRPRADGQAIESVSTASQTPGRAHQARPDPEEARRRRLAYFDRPGTSNGPTEAINGRLEHSAAPPSGSATSPTTSPDPCSKPEASGPDYTLDSDEPQ